MRISEEQRQQILNDINESMKSDISIVVSSLSKYNMSNVNDIRKLHVIKDPEKNTIYCRENETANGYKRSLNGKRKPLEMPLRITEDDLCKRCVIKLKKERYMAVLDKLKKNIE